MTIPPEMLGPLAVAVVAALLLLFVGWRFARWRVARRTAKSRRKGRRGEKAGIELLQKAGYAIVDTQATATMTLVVDGETHSFTVRADALVEKGGRTWVAEIKGGEQVSRIEHRGTRRQLIEYLHAFETDAVLLVDTPRRQVREVRLG